MSADQEELPEMPKSPKLKDKSLKHRGTEEAEDREEIG